MNNKKKFIYIMICDKEPVYLRKMKDNIIELSQDNAWDVQVDLFSDTNALFQCIRRRKANKQSLPDIVFTDIQMDGIAFGKQLRKETPETYLIFVTKNADYALEGYEVRAFRCLLKPVSRQEILNSIRDYLQDKIDTRKWIVKSQTGDLVIELQDIIYMSAEDKYTIFHTLSGNYLDRSSLNTLEKQLEQCGFCRIHRKYLVNMRHHKGDKGKMMILTDDILLPISRRKEASYRKEVSKCLK